MAGGARRPLPPMRILLVLGLALAALSLARDGQAVEWRAPRSPAKVSLAPTTDLKPGAEVAPAPLPAATYENAGPRTLERLPPPSFVYRPHSEVVNASGIANDGGLQLISFEQAAGDPEPPQPPPASGEAANGQPASAPTDPAAPAASSASETPQRPIGREPVSYALQFLRAQDVLLAPGAWQFDTGLAYALFDNDFPLPLRDPVTNEIVDVVEGHARLRLLYTPLGVRYGLTRNVQLFGYLPTGWSNTQFSVVGESEERNKGGIGDLTAGASVHLLKGEGQMPDVIANIGFTAPTGPFDVPLFGLAPGSGLGQGFWALSGQLLCIHRYDPIIVFYGGGYRHLFERELNGVLQAPGEQINYQFGVGFAVNDRVTLSTAFQGFYITDTHLDSQLIEGTNLEPMSIRFAATIARNCRIIEPFVIVGMTDSAPQGNCGITVTFY